MKRYKNILAALCFLGMFCNCRQAKNPFSEWRMYGGHDNIHYSSLNQIDTANVTGLKVAWEFQTGDMDTANHSQIQCNPIIIDDVIYCVSPKMKLFALDAATGKQKWAFNPLDSLRAMKINFVLNNCRGVSYWTDGSNDKRIFYTAGSYLFAVDANTGRAIPAFGQQGKIDLHDGLGRDVKDLFVTSTSPPGVYKDFLILGTRVDEGPAAAPGHIRAFDARTGQLKWIFHTIPHPGEFGHETWDDTSAYRHIGGANAWSGVTVDQETGIVYAPTGSASFDFYGGKRTGNNLFADCIIALDASTGKRIWHFQGIHHDVWDKDFSSPPALITVTENGNKTPAIALTTKTGFIYLFERKTGRSIYPITEQPVPAETELVGEKLSPTQPIPSAPKPFVRQIFGLEDINKYLPDSSVQDVKKRLLTYRNGNMFNPPTLEGTVILPGFDGGGEWGGPAFDPISGDLFVNANEMAWVLTIVPLKSEAGKAETFPVAGERLYKINCMACHGPDRKGSANIPSLINIEKKYKADSFYTLISSGRRMMPAFKQLSEQEKQAIASFVLSDQSKNNKVFVETPGPEDAYRKLPYTMTGYNKFLSKDGQPAINPPWGTLQAINLNSTQTNWKGTLGESPDLAKKGIRSGTENYGGSVVTAGGLLFIGATSDGKFRAFNKRTGQLLWEMNLPASAFATPAVYSVNGKQYIVVACGGGKLNTHSGDSYMAFALP
ncbi:MAG: pyrrolo-quinoline quinone [Bacteroidetes bacterium]|nr:MAG: pyrrolo-quinoline quinone [Bacteroidota bacterium]